MRQAIGLALGALLGARSVAAGGLPEQLGLRPEDQARAVAGAVVTRVLDSADPAAIHALGVVRVRAPRARLVACALDPQCLRRSEDLREAGRFGRLPSSADLAALPLEAADLSALPACSVGRCRLRLWAEAIERLRRATDEGGGGVERAAAAELRRLLAEYARAYGTQGADALAWYADKPRPVSVRAALERLLPEPAGALDRAVRGWLLAGGGAEPLDSYLAWTHERVWRKTVTSLLHVGVFDAADLAPGALRVAVAQIYASHYYEAAVDLLVFVPFAGPEDGLLLFASRTRADIRPRGFSWLERLLIKRLVSGRLQRQLGELRQRLEAAPREDAARRVRLNAGG